MSYRSAGITGTNNIPLGTRRRFGGGDSESASPPAEDGAGYGSPDGGYKRGRSPVRCKFSWSALARATLRCLPSPFCGLY